MSSMYDQNIVIDLEFVPVPKRAFGDLRLEVIQVGAVRVDGQGCKVDSFCRMVRPEYASDIPSNIRRLTGITWFDVCEAASFPDVLGELAEWIGEAQGTRMVQWSNSDLKQIEDECAAKGVDLPACLAGRWLDLQRVFPRVMGIGKRRGTMALHTAIEWYGAELEGENEHTAIADAEHTADLLCMLMTGEHLAQKAAWSAVMPSHYSGNGNGGGSRSGYDAENACGIGNGGANKPADHDGPEPKGSMAKALEALYRQMCCGNAAVVAVAPACA